MYCRLQRVDKVLQPGRVRSPCFALSTCSRTYMMASKIQILPLRRAQSVQPTRTSRSPTRHSDDGDDMPPATKRSRASKPKVRTGCLTCKIRRVKCDEGKPACQKCTSTGRKCDGYYIAPRKAKSENSITDVVVITRKRI